MSSSTFVDNAEYRKVSMMSMLGMLSKRQRMRQPTTMPHEAAS